MVSAGFDYLKQLQKPAAGDDGDAEQRELAFKMMCRLANPLLRRPLLSELCACLNQSPHGPQQGC